MYARQPRCGQGRMKCGRDGFRFEKGVSGRHTQPEKHAPARALTRYGCGRIMDNHAPRENGRPGSVQRTVGGGRVFDSAAYTVPGTAGCSRDMRPFTVKVGEPPEPGLCAFGAPAAAMLIAICACR